VLFCGQKLFTAKDGREIAQRPQRISYQHRRRRGAAVPSVRWRLYHSIESFQSRFLHTIRRRTQHLPRGPKTRNCKTRFSALIFVLVMAASLAQELPPNLNPWACLRNDWSGLAVAVQRSIDDKRIAGAVTLVVRRGRVAWFKPQGMMDREAGKPMRPDTIFMICSMTKPITSVAVMMPYEEGHFLLDDPISKYLPEFKNPKVLVKPSRVNPTRFPRPEKLRFGIS
jgi:hypothetical protein